MLNYSPPLSKLIECLQRLPGIGPKSAQRLAFHILRGPEAQARELAEAILTVKEAIHYCKQCFNFSDQELCPICADERRDRSRLCVVSEPQDLMALERTREYDGMYHVLGGVLAPMDGIGPDDLRIRELLARTQSDEVQEVILALNPSVEGDATANYIAQLLKPLGRFRITRIASGLPVGGDLDYADQVTVAKALAGRQEM